MNGTLPGVLRDSWITALAKTGRYFNLRLQFNYEMMISGGKTRSYIILLRKVLKNNYRGAFDGTEKECLDGTAVRFSANFFRKINGFV